MSAEVEDDLRNEYGLPPISVTARERSNQTTNVDQSVNKPLPWVAFACAMGGGALIGVFMIALLMPRIIDSKIEEGIAKAKSEMAQQAATANAVANEARVHARVSLDKVEDMRNALAEKGIKIELDGH